MVFYLSKRPMMDRHTAVSLPYNTETIDSPMEGVIRVNLFHFAGGTGKKPSFDIHEQAVPEDRLSSEYDEEAQIFDQYFAAEGSTFQEGYTAKGDTYFVLNENDSDITYLQYDRDSQNGNCGLYVLFKASKSSDGSWSPSDAQMQNTYAYEYSTGAIVESGKTDWSDAGSEEYQNLTGEP